MTGPEVAAILEDVAREVEHLPGVSRTRPHIFAESKGDLAHKLRVRAKELRTVSSAPKALPALQPGIRVIPPSLSNPRGGQVMVELRGRRRA